MTTTKQAARLLSPRRAAGMLFILAAALGTGTAADAQQTQIQRGEYLARASERDRIDGGETARKNAVKRARIGAPRRK
jgi:hypothetical protein